MSSSTPNAESSDPESDANSQAGSHTTDESVLPNVQPPSAGFIVQLFIIPGVIVCAIVLVWLAMNWLARDSSDPGEYLEKIRNRSGDYKFAAANLAEVLRSSKNKKYLVDPEFAKQLGEVLESIVKSGESDKTATAIRSSLCLAAGRFYIADTLPALIYAADADHEESVAVRVFALQGILNLALNIREPLVDELLPSIYKTCQPLVERYEKQDNKKQLTAQLKKVSQQANDLREHYLQKGKFAQECVTLADELDRLLTMLSSEDFDQDALQHLKNHISTIRSQSEHAKKLQWDDNAPLAQVLKQAAGTQNEEYDNLGSEIREHAAFVLPFITGKQSTLLLVSLLNDSLPAVSYNAANGLARLGNLKSAEVLIEMLDPEMDQFKLKNEAYRINKRNLIIINALKSMKTLAELNPHSQLKSCAAALETLLAAEQSITSEIRVHAKELLAMLKKR